MTRRACALALLAGVAAAQVRPPRIGFVLLRDGTLRRLYGVAGTFVLGDKLFEGASAAWFDGSTGYAQVDGEVVRFDADGRPKSNRNRVVETDVPPPGAHGEFDELVVQRTGARVRLPFAIRAVFRCGAEYVVAHGDRESAVVWIAPGRERAFELPEVPE